MSTFRINGTDLWDDPTESIWQGRDQLGMDGNGHPVYPAVREFEMRWQLMSSSGFSQLQNFYNVQNVTGTSIVDLPQFAASYQFVSYTGCVLHEPTAEAFFAEWRQNVILHISMIRV